MRFLIALAGALLITVLVFLFMRSLIENRREEGVDLVVYNNVEILRREEPEEEPDVEEEQPEEPPEEPTMDAMDVIQVSPPTPEPATELEIPALDLAMGDISIQAVGDRWRAPLGRGADVVNMAGGGQDARGYVEVVPFNTRRPNVPEVAWQNQIDGWVLVAFTITPEGRTRDVRVLDARPRGVFEEKVISAVEDWQYRLNFSSRNQYDVTLTQKVEVLWQNYPQNLPNVD